MKIAVVCAVNPSSNPGMVSVDRAAVQLFSGLNAEVDWLYAGVGEYHAPGMDEFAQFRSVFGETEYPEKYDRIIFWGDFLQCLTHHHSLAESLIAKGYVEDRASALQALRRVLLLEGASSRAVTNAAIIGGSIHPDGATALADAAYMDALSHLLAEARSVRMREPLSAYRASLLGRRDGTTGMDAAFFRIRSHSWNAEAAKRRRVGPARIGVVGGRSSRAFGRKLKVAALSTLWAFKRNGVDAKLEVIPWLSPSLGRWFGVRVEGAHENPGPEYCLDRLLQCDALVTDVYHAAINAWSVGIPVALLGVGAEVDITTIQSKKKELLAVSLFAGNNYFFYENISFSNAMEVGRAIHDALTDDAQNEAIFRRRRGDAEWIWRIIRKELCIADWPSSTGSGVQAHEAGALE